MRLFEISDCRKIGLFYLAYILYHWLKQLTSNFNNICKSVSKRWMSQNNKICFGVDLHLENRFDWIRSFRISFNGLTTLNRKITNPPIIALDIATITPIFEKRYKILSFMQLAITNINFSTSFISMSILKL